jgi:hypothetical protein
MRQLLSDPTNCMLSVIGADAAVLDLGPSLPPSDGAAMENATFFANAEGRPADDAFALPVLLLVAIVDIGGFAAVSKSTSSQLSSSPPLSRSSSYSFMLRLTALVSERKFPDTAVVEIDVGGTLSIAAADDGALSSDATKLTV